MFDTGRQQVIQSYHEKQRAGAPWVPKLGLEKIVHLGLTTYSNSGLGGNGAG